MDTTTVENIPDLITSTNPIRQKILDDRKLSAHLLTNESNRKTKDMPPPLPPRKSSPTATTSGLAPSTRSSFEIKILSQELRQQSTSYGRGERTQSLKEGTSNNFSKLSPNTIQTLLEETPPPQMKSTLESRILEEDNLLSNVKAIELLDLSDTNRTKPQW